MHLEFTGCTEISGKYLDFGHPFEFADGRRFRPRLLTAVPLGAYVRCEAEIAAEMDGELLHYLVNFHDMGVTRHLLAQHERILCVRMRQLIYRHLNTYLATLPQSLGPRSFEFEIHRDSGPPIP